VFDTLSRCGERASSGQLRQVGLDLAAARLQKGGKLQLAAHGLRGLVGGKARRVRGDLEQDAVGLLK
jgi:hypothetical protein